MPDLTVNEATLAHLIGVPDPEHDASRPDGKPSLVLQGMLTPPNANYRVTQVVNVTLPTSAVELISDQVGRVYIRSGTTLYAVTMSDFELHRLAKQITNVRKARDRRLKGTA
jgi:hypothetical protein